ncbi:MAG TPA: HEAT repeat domain-containing protein [Vicinamibacterales bacterium]|nr:HEAT repeat domain-containing protein [Vicinamibacterales bacterium]
MNSRRTLVVACVIALANCGPKTDPVVTATPPPAVFEQKMRWILQLEDQRQLRGGGGDLVALLGDTEARIRRRTALAIGRVKLAEGVPALTAVLQSDADAEVRQMAAFAMGLIGDAAAAPALTAALNDADPLIQGRAAEALGLIAHKPATQAITNMVFAHVNAGALNGIEPDDMGSPKPAAVEAIRLGAYALVRLGSYDALASAFVADGKVRSRWWPIAYAIQRVNDPRALPVLLDLFAGGGQLTRAFAARGLGNSKDPRAVTPLLAAAEDAAAPLAVRIQSVRAIAQLGDARGGAVMRRLILSPRVDQNLQLEAITALAQLRDPAAVELLIDLVSAQWPSVRAAALNALAQTDADTFVTSISGLEQDDHWSVRASLATTIGTLGRERAEAPLTARLTDSDRRVLPAVLDALAKVGAANAAEVLTAHLKSDDPVVRAAAARGLATIKAPNAAAALADAVKTAQSDGLYVARAAALDALTAIDPAVARSALIAALTDRDWAVRVRAAEHLRRLDAAADLSAMRPAPPPQAPELNAIDSFIAPKYSPQAYIDTSKGTIQFELAVLDAPRTVANFIALVRKNYFRGVQLHRVVPDFVVQDGDPRGDGEGGPGYTIRDEINQRPFLRGTVGMALDWPDTGGSQFFITHSPQPHLDGRYTVFGQVVAGMDVVDRLQQWDTITAIRVWDGVNWIGQ